MTLITKTAITFLLTVVSVFVLNKPPAPSAADLQPRYDTVYEGNATPPNIPTTTVTTLVTLVTPPIDLCGQVFNMAKAIGFPVLELTTVVAVAQRESRCQPDAFNPNDTYGQSYGVMQINSFWCKPSRYWPKGYLQAYGLLTDCNNLFDLETNLRSALAIFRYSEGWRAWGK